jgi:hypothetical protein
MNLINENDPVRQAARTLSERLGRLAATSPAAGPEAALTQLATHPSSLPARLSAILTHFRQRNQRREHAADKLRANEFLTGQYLR